MNPTTLHPRAKTRTWKATTTHLEYGVVRSVVRQTVILTRDEQGRLSATVDGLPVPYAQAVAILNAATRTELVVERLLGIGKPAARELHIELGRLGYRSPDHYALAADALCLPEVASLAALTAEEAKVVRSYAYGQLGWVA